MRCLTEVITGFSSISLLISHSHWQWAVPTPHLSEVDHMTDIADVNWQPKIVAFLCNWCSYGAADLAGVSRLQYPPCIRAIRVPCTGRMNPKFLLAAFRQGADGIWVSG